MNKLVRGSMMILLGASIVGAGMLASPERADAAYGFGGFRSWGGGFYAGGPTSISFRPTSPQFPPVYYKHPVVARQYGQSPFPYPACGCQDRGRRVAPKPVTVHNPYYQPKAKEAKGKTTQYGTPEPEIVYNPYVDQPESVAGQVRVKAVQVVYPAAAQASE